MAFYFKQLLSGRDFAQGDELAGQMRNFIYFLGDESNALVVDPAYDVDSLLKILDEDGVRLAGILVTHYHPDHIGGSMMGFTIKGISDLLDKKDVPVHVNSNEIPWVLKTAEIPKSSVIGHDSGDEIVVGDVKIQLIHTPGHTPGSQCFLVNKRLISGDTLFLQGCGRTDLPGANPEDMYYSLTDKIAKLDNDIVVFPGHMYSSESCASLEAVKSTNYAFKPKSLEDWLSFMG
jgi:glyoxylase-like metal-dependent hydrolase (beta-lactamase superfamily II)